MTANDRRPLSGRGLDVLHGASLGETAQQTARRLGISETTVRAHRSQVSRRLGARNMPHAVAIAFRTGLLSGPNDLEV